MSHQENGRGSRPDEIQSNGNGMHEDVFEDLFPEDLASIIQDNGLVPEYVLDGRKHGKNVHEEVVLHGGETKHRGQWPNVNGIIARSRRRKRK
jgi:hypothetical protein